MTADLSFYHFPCIMKYMFKLCLSNIIKDRFNIDWNLPFKANASRKKNTRAQQLNLFETQSLSKQKQESEFRTRDGFLANAVGKKIGFNLDENEHSKNLFAEVHKKFS